MFDFSSLPFKTQSWVSPGLTQYVPGKTRLGILLHGYGANKDDLIGLAPELSVGDHDWIWLSPDAPDDVPGMMFGGKQWFSIANMDPNLLDQGSAAARPALMAYIAAALSKTGLGYSDLVLCGFSQGCMMALEAGLRLPKTPLGLIGFSGALTGPERLAQEIKVKPPVQLIHGELDPIVPFTAMEMAEANLKALGVNAQSQACPALPHSIDQVGLMAARSFIQSL